MRKIESGISGSRPRASLSTKAASKRPAVASSPSRVGAAPAALGCLDQRVDEQEHPAGDEDGAAHVEASPRPQRPIRAEQPERADEDQRAEREVDEQHPAPPRPLRQHSAEEDAGGGAETADRAPDPECLVPVDALLEQGGDERERRRCHQRGAEALREPGGDQRRLVSGESAGKRAAGEEEDAGDEHAPPPEQVGGAAAEQQEAAVGEHVAARDPLQVLL